jgi:hypothetical protein
MTKQRLLPRLDSAERKRTAGEKKEVREGDKDLDGIGGDEIG